MCDDLNELKSLELFKKEVKGLIFKKYPLILCFTFTDYVNSNLTKLFAIFFLLFTYASTFAMFFYILPSLYCLI